MNCNRCGFPFLETETPNTHKNCDESFPEETWQTPEEIQARAEVLERQRRLKSGPTVTVESILQQIQKADLFIGKKGNYAKK